MIASGAPAPASLHPDEVYPQIVRLSLVQGDVRVAVRKVKGQHDVAPWAQAAVNMPLETGFSVVTGNGRAEIEFEDASTMYLGENSALTFDELSTQNNLAYTEMTLLTGVATLHLRPVIGEMYVVNSPTDFLRIRSNADVRVNSYTDAMTVTPVLFTKPHLGGALVRPDMIGKTFKLQSGIFAPTTPPAGIDYATWDAWVAKRVAARAEAMHTVMKESGLNGPLPGLADMEAQGTFFECKPYGTCWVPTNGWGREHAAQRPGAAVVLASAKVPAQGEPSVAQQQLQTQQATTQQAPTQQAPTPEQMQNAKLAQQAQTMKNRRRDRPGVVELPRPCGQKMSMTFRVRLIRLRIG